MSDTSSVARIAIGVLSVVAVGVIVPPTVRSYNQQLVRDALWDELRPVALKNCEMGRLGRAADGGYVVCTNLLADVKATYSYGIAGEDSFGCAASELLDIEVHQYDCFDLTEVECPQATPIFHAECVGAVEETIGGRLFDSVANQIDKTGHAGEHVLLKMDIDGAEITSLMATPPETLALVDQIVIELHGVTDPAMLELVRYLKTHFHLADLHFNNYGCKSGVEPFPSPVPEVLFVNKRLTDVDPSGTVPFPNPGWAANDPSRPDCQVQR